MTERPRIRAPRLCTFVIGAILALVLSFGGADVSAQAVTDPVQTEGVIEVGDAAISDAQILTRINNLLSEIDGYQGVSVAVAEGVVTLTGGVVDNVQQAELTQIVNRVAGVVAIDNQTNVSGSLEERLTPAIERIAVRTQNLLTNAPIFLIAFAAFLIVAGLGWMVTTRLTIWKRLAPNSFIADVYRAVARILFVILGIVLALDILNATALIGAVLGAAGVVGLAVGFAVRDTVENFIASILLSLRQPFRPNDFVDIQGDQGTVARLTSRATILISPEGNHIRVPNATVFKGRIVNYTRDPERRFDFDLGVDADADLAAALTTATSALRDLPFVLRDPAVSAWIKEVGDSNVILTFNGWVNQTQTSFLKARGEAIRTAKTALEAAGFGLPEPIYRVRLDGQGTESPQQKSTGSTKHSADTTTATAPLPSAADPAKKEDASDEAARRERTLKDGEENLLDAGQMTE